MTQYDVFLSHNSADKPGVEELARRLTDEAGLRPFLDKWHLVPGQPWQEAIEETLRQSETVAVFIGPSGLSPWHNEEMRAAIDTAVRTRDEYRVIPVLLPGASPEAVTGFLARRTWVDFRPGLDDAEAFQRLVAGIKGEAMDIGVYELPDEPAPYRGLLPFKAEHAEFFFGREADTQRLIEKLGQGTFVAVIGASGSGKSSLARAGLLPALARDALPDSSNWHTLLLTPGGQPLRALAEGLATFVPPADRLRVADELQDRLATRADGLRTAATTLLADDPQPLLLVIDQFEEVFTLCQDGLERCRAQARQFIANLADTARRGDRRILILITLRADFLDRCLAFPQLKDLLQDRQMLLGPLDEPALRDAIVRPAQAVGAYFEKGLVSTILRDVGAQPGALPLLQHALYELWRARRGPWLTLDAYEASGGVSGALQRRAQATYDALTPDQQAIARNIFLRLTALGEGVSDMRRRVSRSELYPAGVDPGQVDTVLQALSGPQARLIIADEQTVEVAHEALIQQWNTLHEWLQEDRAGLRIHRKLTESAIGWERNNGDESYLYRGARLAEAEDWAETQVADLNPVECEFLRASIEAREAERHRMQRVIAGLVVGLVIISALALFAWGRSQLAEQRQVDAENAKATAQAEATRTINAEATADARRIEAEQAQADAEAQRDEAERTSTEIRSLALAGSAQQALNDGNIDLAIALALHANQMDHPPAQAQTILGEVAYASETQRRFTGHDNWVLSVAFSPDGRTALSGSADKSLILWDVESGNEIHRLGDEASGHSDWVWDVAFSPDGRIALSGSADNSLILWDVESGKELHRFTGHTDEVRSVAYSPDGHNVLSGSRDTTVRLWDRESGEELRRFEGHTDEVRSVAFGPDGSTVLSGSADNNLILWDVKSGKEIHRFNGHTGLVLSVAFSPDGRTALSGSADKSLILWDIASGNEIRRFEGHSSWVYGVAFSPDGRIALSGSADKSLILWDVESGKELHRFIGHTDEVQSVAFSPDGRTALSGSRDKYLRLWDVESHEEIRHFTGHSDRVTSIAFSPSGRTALSGSMDKSLILWDIEKGSEIRRFEGHNLAVSSVAFGPDGRTVLSGSYDGSLILWNLATGTRIRRFEGHSAAVRSVALSPDGRTALSGGGDSDHRLILWDVATGREKRQFHGHTNWVTSVAFSPDGHTAISGSHDHSLILWDIETGAKIKQLEGHTDWVTSVAFSPDGRTALSGSADNSIILWDIESGDEIRRFEGHSDRVWSVVFSPDGRAALSGAADGSLILWSVESGKELRHFTGHAEWVTSAAFSPDGLSALSGSSDGTLRLWRIQPLAPEELIAWLNKKRYVYELERDERERYCVEPFCGE
jgi:WD40 repeat protein